jgi:hypothetical protein
MIKGLHASISKCQYIFHMEFDTYMVLAAEFIALTSHAVPKTAGCLLCFILPVVDTLEAMLSFNFNVLAESIRCILTDDEPLEGALNPDDPDLAYTLNGGLCGPGLGGVGACETCFIKLLIVGFV